MAGQRTTGVSGLLSGHAAAEHGFWPGGFPGDHPLPTKHTPQSAAEAGVVGRDRLLHQDILEADAAARGAPPFPEYFRRIEVQGYPLKVRYLPDWAVKAKALYEAEKLDPKAMDAFARSMKGKRPAARRFIVSSLMPVFRSNAHPDLTRLVASFAPPPTLALA